jgi:hypothetical protein
MFRTLLITTLLLGCGGKEADKKPSEAPKAADTAKPAEAPKAADDGKVAAAVKTARTNLPMIQKALAEKNSVTAMFECPETLKVMADLEKGDKALATEIDQLCNHDIYAAEVKAEVDAIEAERTANPDTRRLAGCYQLKAKLAIDKMTKAGKLDDATTALFAKRETLCVDPGPKKK